MSASPDPRHFARAVTTLGEKRPVVASSAIFNAQGLKIIDKGVVVDARLYERLTQHQLLLPLQQCVEAVPSVTGPLLRDAVRALGETEPAFRAMLDDRQLRDSLFDELLLLPLPQPVAFQLTLMNETQPSQWQHALRCALTAAWLGACAGANRYDMRLLAAGGLLHDLGMLHLDPVLLRPELELSLEHRRQLYSHPLVSVMLLERHHEYPRELLSAVMEHHESLDGGGYPRNLAGAALSPWGRVLALAEVVSSMLAPDRPAPKLRLSLVLRMNRHRFDPLLVREVTRLLAALGPAAAPPRLDRPGDVLLKVHALHGGWAVAVPDPAALPEARAQAVGRVRDLCGQAQRALSTAGASPLQLEQLGDISGDDGLCDELSLVAVEATWQLRAVARQARRRWHLGEGEVFPASLRSWLDEVDAFCARHLQGQEPAAKGAAAAPD